MALSAPAVRKRSPLAAVGTLLVGVLYGASPIDLIPDLLPLLGWSDDVVVLLTAAALAWRFWRGRTARAASR